MTAITENVLRYQRVGTGLDHIVRTISELVYRYPIGRSGFSEEDSAEFLLRFYPRIERLVRRYKSTGSSFETYLTTTLRWQLRSFAAEHGTSKIQLRTALERTTIMEVAESETATWHTDRASDFSINTVAPEEVKTKQGDHFTLQRHAHHTRPTKKPKRLPYRPSVLGLSPTGLDGDRLTPGEAQRLLCVALRAADRLDLTMYQRLASIVGCDRRWIEDRWHELRDSIGAVRSRKEKLRKNRDYAWFRVRCIETRIKDATPEELSRLMEERYRWWRRCERARSALRKVPPAPTHAQIAGVLGIAKGTVDSSVFKARRELRSPAYRQRLVRLFHAT